MKLRIYTFTLTIFALLFSVSSYAWVTNDAVAITKIYQFESGINRDYSILEFSNNGEKCRIPHTDKELFSLALSLYMAGKTVSVVCYPTQDDPGGVLGGVLGTHNLIML